MSTTKWCIWTVPFLKDPGGARILDISLGALVDVTGEQVATHDSGRELTWSRVNYRGQSGWIYDGYLEDYVQKFPNGEVKIAHPTPDPFDAAQYMLIDGRVKHNVCGELCVAFVTGDDIETFLKKWRDASPHFYDWALGEDSDKTLGVDALSSMVGIYAQFDASLRFDDGLRDSYMGFKVSPGRLKKMLEKYYLIIAVHIDMISGRLRGEGLNHWVVLDKVSPNGINGGWVELYNPFPNRREEYSYDEFMRSVGPFSSNGLWVPRRLASR
jgi:hypothetical protein